MLRAGDAQCGTGTCQAIQGLGICTYAAAEQKKMHETLALTINPDFTNPTHCACDAAYPSLVAALPVPLPPLPRSTRQRSRQRNAQHHHHACARSR